jgi:hypothetical protein
MLRKTREWARTFLSLDLLFTVAGYVVAAVFGTLFLIVVILRGDQEQILPLLGTVVGALVILGFFSWISRDARKAGQELRRQRKRSRARPDGDGSDVAGAPRQPPRMG